MPLAPIALFVFNRLDHTIKTVDALKENTLACESDLYIFSDAAKTELQEKSIKNVREYISQIEGFKSISIIQQPSNIGLANSIIGGVTKLCAEFGRVIVIEDDLITSRFFLQYMNDALDFYENHETVAAIDAYMYPIQSAMPDTFFTRDPGCWGWATWQRAWRIFEPDGNKLLTELKNRNLEKAFDYEGSYPYTKMLIDQIKNKNNSWAIRWYASIFLQDKLALHVGKSLVHNSGNDSSGTHGGETSIYFVEISNQPVHINKIPVCEDVESSVKIASFLKSTQHSIPKLIYLRLKKLFNKVIRIK